MALSLAHFFWLYKINERDLAETETAFNIEALDVKK